MLRPAGVTGLFAPLLANADQTAKKAPMPSAAPEMFSGGYLLQVFASLLIVIALMFAVLWALKRVNGVSRGASGQLRVLASVGLGQRERAVLISAGDKQMLLGVAPGSVTTLHIFDQPVVEMKTAEAGNAQATTSFSEVWKLAVSKRGGNE